MYFASWVIASGAYTRHGPRWFIFLTHWGLLLLIAYLLTAAICSTYKMIKEFGFAAEKPEDLAISSLQDPSTTGCGCGKNGGIPWYLSLTWVLFLVSSELSIPIVLFYWTNPDDMINHWGVTLHVHLFNIFPGLVDVFISGFPVRLLHFFYIVGFASVYAVFTGIYYAAGGTNTDGDQYIYKILDYENQPVTSSIVIIAMVFVVSTLMHLIYWGLYLLRVSLLCQKLPKDYSVENPVLNHTERPQSLSIEPAKENNNLSVPYSNINTLNSSPAGSETGLLSATLST